MTNDPRAAMNDLRSEVAKVVIGQDAVVTGLVLGLLCRGHVLLEGVPGTAKTLLVRALAGSLGLATGRIQFTPDLMPGDVIGSTIYDEAAAEFSFRPGPVFTNLLLADEINRTPPKTQSALLEAMAERQVTVDGTTYPLGEPFLVVATQNPVEFEGTYPLPEAQLDRFLMKLQVNVPNRADEIDVVRAHIEGFSPDDLPAAGLRQVVAAEHLAAGRAAIDQVRVDPLVISYCVDLAAATRSAPGVRLGVSPRGAVALATAARAWAWLSGRAYTTPDHVKTMAVPVLSHRIGLFAEAELDGVTSAAVVMGALATVPVPR